MWALTPLFMVIIMLIMTGLLLFGVIWIEKFPLKEDLVKHPLYKMIRALVFTVYTYWSVLLLDSFVKITFLGIIGYANFSYHLAPMLLALILGIVMILGIAFVAPTLKSIISFLGVAGYSLYYLEVIANQAGRGELEMLYQPIVWGISITVGVNLLFGIIEMIRGTKFEVLWDWSETYRKHFGAKFYIIMFLLVCAEFILKFEGLSLLYWLF